MMRIYLTRCSGPRTLSYAGKLRANASPRKCCRASLSTTSEPRKWSTPLAKQLADAIATTGPISLAAYMRQCLTAPDGGYYTSTRKEGDQFGAKGDFITSPEISQVFGELVGIWFVAEWIAQGKRSSGVHLIEVGPGRGTLMDDMLRTIRNFKSMASSIEAVYLVEASPSLRQAQNTLLCGDAPLKEIDIGFQSTSKYLPGTKIVWCEDLRLVPREMNASAFIIAHEFFDALPIHAFQSVETPSQDAHRDALRGAAASSPTSGSNQWRELMVSTTPPFSSHDSLSIPTSTYDANPPPEFQLSLAKAATPHSMYLPETSSRYKALKSTTGAVVEISPKALSHAADFAIRIGGSSPSQGFSPARRAPTAATKPSPAGAALIIDYGPSSTVPTNTFRGIRSHRTVSPFSSPGLVDLSADVDFLALAEEAINASPGVEVHGPVEQAMFLQSMGIRERAEMLAKKAREGDERNRIETGWKRLVDRGPGGMGKMYKAMAIVPHSPTVDEAGRRRPVGFGGEL